MQRIFWIVGDRLAGRCGPDREPWNLAELKAGGIGAVLSVNDGRLCHPEGFDRLGMAYACVPLSPNAPPRPGDLEQNLAALPLACAFVTEQLAQGRRVLVHCSSGKDRTGLALAYCLMKIRGRSVREAMDEVLAVQPIAFTAEGWEAFATEVLTAAGNDERCGSTALRGQA